MAVACHSPGTPEQPCGELGRRHLPEVPGPQDWAVGMRDPPPRLPEAIRKPGTPERPCEGPAQQHAPEFPGLRERAVGVRDPQLGLSGSTRA